MIPGSANPLLLASAAGDYQVSRSLRFNSSDSGFCSRTPAVAGSRTKWTWAGWVKLGTNFGGRRMLFGGGNIANSIPNTYLEITDSAQLGIDSTDPPSFSVAIRVRTTAVLRDPSAWYHIVFSIDTTQATAANRIKIYINGVEQTSYSSTTYPSQNYDSGINSTQIQTIGAYPEAAYRSGLYFDGYLADVHFIDGQQLTPSSFTEVSATTGQLIPKAYSGSFGTNGFWLKFSDNSAATAATLGKDYSGNSNNWTPNNLSVQGILNYSSNVTTVATSIYNGTPATMFDGSTSTYYGVTSNNGSNSSITIDLTGKGVNVSTGIRVYGTFRTGMVWQINGSTVSSSGVSHPNTGWQTLSGWSAGAITSISSSVPSGSANEIYAIEVNGVILTNSSGAGNDSLVDTPTSYGTDTGVGGEVRGNYATLNPLDKAVDVTLSNGNLEISHSGGDNLRAARATIKLIAGKWYCEAVRTTGSDCHSGIITAASSLLGFASTSVFYGEDGKLYVDGSVATNYGITIAIGDVVGIAVDMDAAKIYFYKNGTLINTGGTSFTTTGNDWFFKIGTYFSGSVNTVNFGQRAFAYTAPSGFKALCDTNLGAPLVAKGNTVMDVALYTGNGGNQSITLPGGFNPDLVWVKSRSNSQDHYLFDAVRGGASILRSNTTGAESTGTAYLSFDTSGFSSLNGLSSNGYTYAAWTWDAGSSTVSNTQGSITSQVRANTSAGFSIVTFTSNASGNATVGHGLGVAPSLVILKNRTGGASNWLVFHKAVCTKDNFLYLNSTNALGTYTDVQGAAIPSSTVFGINAGIGIVGSADCVAYVFSPVVGYSSMGSYVGNGSSDGPFVYTGFRPRWIMFKRTDAAENWTIYDTARDTYNAARTELFAHTSSAESAGSLFVDILSNGFKIRNTNGSFNASSATYIYIAFAENPFQYARAR